MISYQAANHTDTVIVTSDTCYRLQTTAQVYRRHPWPYPVFVFDT